MFTSTILTNVMTTSEGSIVTLLVSLGYVWVGLLLFFGMMVTHDYTLGKNFITAIVSIVGVAFIIFIVGLFSTLVAKVFTFFYNIYVELSYRWS